jgi:aspartyl-tRNA synthetase
MRIRRTHYSTDVTPKLENQVVSVLGWVDEIRDLGKVKFVILRDMKGNIQVTLHEEEVPENVWNEVATLKRESVIGVTGTVASVEKAPRGVEILPSDLEVISLSRELPLDVKGRIPTKLDVRLDLRMLDLRRNEQRAIFRIRGKVLHAIRTFLLERGFMEVQTPKIISSATEGGAALFPILYYGKTAFLAQSPQLYKEQLVAVFERVFEIGPIFRAEEFHTTRHLSEVTSVDIEEAFATNEDVMKLLEELVSHVVGTVRVECNEELMTLRRKLDEAIPPFPRYRYDEVVSELKKKGLSVKEGEDFSTPLLREIGKIYRGFYFITDWPSKIKPFYILPREDNPSYSHSFDFMHGWLEIASGGARVHDEEMLRRKLKEQGLSLESFSYHLKAFKYGMPPHAGWGLGLERLLMVLTGRKNIREVTLFPRDKTRVAP